MLPSRPSTDTDPLTDPAGFVYLAQLVDALGREAADEGPTQGWHLTADIGLLARDCASAQREASYAGWLQLWARYRRIAERVARGFNQVASVSREYASMEEFWDDAGRQAAGSSPFTFWDTYEHGRRRRLEHRFAASYGAGSALLLNSGMSAVAVVIGALNLRAGDVIATGERCYFETSDLLERFVAASGIRIRRVPLDDSGAVIRMLEECAPRLLLFETATNAPNPVCPRSFSRWSSASPGTRMVVDNSVQSHATCWFDIRRRSGVPHLVIESAVKYLTHECMAGVIYGDEEDVEPSRDFARSTGQQLQERAFNWIRPGEVDHAGDRLRLHARNVRAFSEELRAEEGLWTYVRTLDEGAGTDRDAASLFEQGPGCLVFLSVDQGSSGDVPPDQLHRAVVNRWKEAAETAGLSLGIRAGFGWNQTSSRVYESSRLNQPDAPTYIRVSVGIEPEPVVHRLAGLLVESVQQVVGHRKVALQQGRVT